MMKEPRFRLQEARSSAGFDSPSDAARALQHRGVNKNTLISHENGNRPISRKAAELYGQVFGVDPGWILFGSDAGDESASIVPLMGYVGAGAQIEPDFEQTPPEGLDQIHIAIPIPDDMIAFQVKGISMLPRYDEGDVIIVWREQKRATDSFLGEEAAVRTRDGRRFLKTIRRGEKGYTLISWNDHPIEDQEIEWVGEIYVTIRANQLQRMVNQINRQGGIQGQLKLRA